MNKVTTNISSHKKENSALHNENNFLLTVCVITYNRGGRLLNSMPQYLKDLKSHNELLILDNASTEELKEYREIETVSKKYDNVRYIRKHKNTHPWGNFLDSFKNTKSRFLMVLSDEDFPNWKEIEITLNFLSKNPNIGVLKGSMEPIPGAPRNNSLAQRDRLHKKGRHAITNFGMRNNYISGTLYNMAVLNKNGLIEKLEVNLETQYHYPHIYLEMLACAVSDAAQTKRVLVFEGFPVKNSNPDGIGQYTSPYSLGSRVDQFISLRDGLADAVCLYKKDFCHNTFYTCYINLCLKFFQLILVVNNPLYEKNAISKDDLGNMFYYVCMSSITNFEKTGQFEKSMYFINRVHQRLRKIRDQFE